jgi:glycosyltransferase EpsE
MLTEPLVSILMSTFNGSKTLKRSIDSILNQTYKNFEFIIINDGSDKLTSQILQSYSTLDKRIVVIQNSKNLGLTASLNIGIEISKGKYILRMDDDDFSHENRISSQIQKLESDLTISFLSSGFNTIADNVFIKFDPYKINLHPNKHDFLSGNQFAHPGLCIRSSVLKSIGGYKSKWYTYRCEDYYLFMELYSKGYKGTNIPFPLFDYSIIYKTYLNKITLKTSICEAFTRLIGFYKLKIIFPLGIFLVFKPFIRLIIWKISFLRYK